MVRSVLLVAAALFAGQSVACGGSRGALEAGVYRSGPVAVRVPPVPAEGRAVHVPPASLAFRDETHDASILVNGRCGHLDADVPLVALTNQLVMGTTDREIDAQETLPFDAREALHTRMRAKLDGVPMAYDVFVL